MKKILTTLIAAILACMCMAAVMTGCNSADGTDAGAGGDAVAALQMEKRYLDSYSSEYRDMSCYYLFHADGTGEYTYHFDYYYDDKDHPSDMDDHEHYTIRFKYTYADADKSAVVCFFDGVTYLENNGETVDSRWSQLLTVSENVLIAAGSSSGVYVNEDYLKTIPNYNQ